MSIALNATSAVLSVTSFTFYLIGVIGYSLQKGVIENVNWFQVDHVNGLNVYVGLRKLIYQNSGVTNEIIYADSSCNSNFCSACEREGDNAFALLVVALVFTFISVVLSIAAAVVPAKEISGANLASSFVALVFGVIGWSLFVQQCFQEKINDQVDEDFDYGPGAILSLIAFLLSAIVVVLQIGATVLSPVITVTPPAQPKAEAVATNEL